MRGARAKAQRKTAAGPQPAARPRWRIPVVALVAATAVGVPAGWALLSDGDSGASPPPAPDAGVVAPPGTRPAAAVRVVYRLDDTAGPDQQIFTDVVVARLPYDFRLEHREGAPPGGDVASSTVINERFRFNTSRGEERFVTRQVPGPLSGVFSVEVLEGAVAAGDAERLGREQVAGEACTRYAYRQGGNEILTRGDSQERTEACVTPDGVLLSETTVIGGRQVRRTEAVEVDRNPVLSPDTFLGERDPSTEKDVRLLETNQLVSEGEASDDLERVGLSAPPGFEPGRRVTVNRQTGPGAPQMSLYIQSFLRGEELVAVEEVLNISVSAPWPEDEGRPIDLGRGRSGRVVFHTGYAEVRVAVGDEFVRVSSARPDLALSVARTLTDAQQEGAE